MSQINPSALGEQFDADFQAKLDACTTPQEIKTLMHEKELESGVIRLDWDPAYRIPVEPSAAPRKFAQTITDPTGKKVIFEGGSELDVTRQSNAYLREHFSPPTATTQPDRSRDAATGRFTVDQSAQAPAAISDEEKAALDLDFKLGRISAAEYIEKSGAVSEFLANQGIPLETLRETVAEKELGQVQASWERATTEFLNGPAGADWPGGQENLRRIGIILSENPELMDAENKTEALAAAWARMKQMGNVAPNAEQEARNRIRDAQSPEELRAAVGYRGSTGLGW